MSPSSAPAQQVIVVSLDHESVIKQKGPAALLRSLGHRVMIVGYDLVELSGQRVDAKLLVVEIGSHLEIGKDVVKRLRARDDLAGLEILICVDVGRVAGLDVQMGADDFILMPLAVDELSARLNQLKWRGAIKSAAGGSRLGDIVLDTNSLQALSGGQSLKLTPCEFQLLKFLVDRPGRVFTRAELLAHVWGYQHAQRFRTVDTHILNLRGKLGAAGDLIEAVRGMGYKLRKNDPPTSDEKRERALRG